MNWLAHLLLSEECPAYRIGNLLPDFAKPADCTHLPTQFQRGMRQHRRIDAFTDAHPLVRRSVARVGSPLRRFGPIVVDVFYDHFLTLDWAHYSPRPIRELAHSVYGSIDGFADVLGPEIHERLQGLQEGDWICTYGEISGVRKALARLSHRLRRPVLLGDSVGDLIAQYDEFQADFRAFFPRLRTHVSEDPGCTAALVA